MAERLTPDEIEALRENARISSAYNHGVFAHLTPKGSPRRTAIDRALAAYEGVRPEIEANNRGRFVLVKGNVILGVFERHEDAAREALQSCGEWDYVIREIGALRSESGFS